MEDEHGHGGGHEVHLPDPSPWPIVAGAASLLLGAALVWWARDTGSDVAAVALGAALAVTLLAVAGWAYEDGRMRARAASHEEPWRAGAARFTQVLTFAIAEGQLATARQGILAEIDSRENSLRDLAGFQDLRIVVSPVETGPAQVIVETTWSNREGLATYDETRETLLDLVGNHPEEVVPGSVQVFDMEVVRDTKDVAVRFGLGTATALLGSLIIGGFFVGAGLTLFESEGGGGEGGGGNGNGGAPSGFAQTGVIPAIDNAFPEDAISLPPETEVTLTFANEGNTPHNFQLFQGSSAGDGPLVEGCTAGCPGTEVTTPDLVAGGEEAQFTFTTPGEGDYAYWCSLHPTEMQGVLTVAEGVPVPGEGAPSNGGGGGSDTDTSVSADNIEFSTDQLTFAANEEVTFTFDNQDDGVPHNIEFFLGATPGEGPLLDTCTEGCDGGGSEVKTAMETGPVEQTFTFTTPDAGTYSYWCIVHPTTMLGTITVQ